MRADHSSHPARRPARQVAWALGLVLLAGCNGGGETTDDAGGVADPPSAADEVPVEEAPVDEPSDEEDHGDEEDRAGDVEPLAVAGSSWFPLVEGTTWTYAQDAAGTAVRQDVELVSVEETAADGGVTITLSNTFDDGTEPFALDYVVNDDGSIDVPLQTLSFEGVEASVETNGALVWPSPEQFADGSVLDGTFGLVIGVQGQQIEANAAYTTTPVGVETVTVPAGDYEASRFTIEQTITTQGFSQDVTIDVWMVEGIGYVKQVVKSGFGALTVELVDVTAA